MMTSEVTFSPAEILSGDALSALIGDERPVWLWSDDGRHILWANTAGVQTFGAKSLADLRARELPRDAAASHIARVAVSNSAPSLARLRYFRGLKPLNLMAVCQGVALGNDRRAVIGHGLEAGTDSASDGAARVRADFDSFGDGPFALVDADGHFVATADARFAGALSEALDAAGGRLENVERITLGDRTRILAKHAFGSLGHSIVLAGDIVTEDAADEAAEAETLVADEAEVLDESAIVAGTAGVLATGTAILSEGADDGESASEGVAPGVAEDIPGADEEAAQDAAMTSEEFTSGASLDEERPGDSPVAEMTDEPESAATDGDAVAEGDAEEGKTSDGNEDSSEPHFVFVPGDRPARFVWQMDVESRFTYVSTELAAAVGPRAADLVGRSWAEIAAEFDIDRDGKVARALARCDTWSGVTIDWPVDGTDLRVPVDLAALPAFGHKRTFEGFRGFGVCRTMEASTPETPDENETSSEKKTPELVLVARDGEALVEPGGIAEDPMIPAEDSSEGASPITAATAGAGAAILAAGAFLSAHLETAPEGVDDSSVEAPVADGEMEAADLVSEYIIDSDTGEIPSDDAEAEHVRTEDVGPEVDVSSDAEPDLFSTVEDKHPVEPHRPAIGSGAAELWSRSLPLTPTESEASDGQSGEPGIADQPGEAVQPAEASEFAETAEATPQSGDDMAEAEVVSDEAEPVVETEAPVSDALKTEPDISADSDARDAGSAGESEVSNTDAAHPEARTIEPIERSFDDTTDGDETPEEAAADAPAEAEAIANPTVTADYERGMENIAAFLRESEAESVAPAEAAPANPASEDTGEAEEQVETAVATDTSEVESEGADAREQEATAGKLDEARADDESDDEEPADSPEIADEGEADQSLAPPAVEKPVFAMPDPNAALPAPPNVVMLSDQHTKQITDAHDLSRPEREAFKQIASLLGARLEGDDEDTQADEPTGEDEDKVVTLPSAFAAGKPQPIDPTLLDRLPIGVLIARDHDVLYVNQPMLDLTGYDTGAGLASAGGLDALFVDPEEWEETGDESESDRKMPIRRRDGEKVSAVVRLHAVPWNGGNALMMSFRPAERTAAPDTATTAAAAAAGSAAAGLATDQSEPPAGAPAERSATYLSHRVEELETIIDTATDGVLMLDGEGLILGVNRSAEALFGTDRTDMIGETLARFLAPESRRTATDYLDGLARNGVASVLNDGREVIGEVSGGGLIPLFMTIGRLNHGTTGKFCAVLRDITQWKRAEEELTSAKRHADDASSQKSDFLAKISLEVRTPLNAIIGFSEVMMEERFGPVGNERYRDYLRDIHASGTQIMCLINDLVDLTRVEAGKLDLSFEAVSANDIIQECVALTQPRANRERVIIRTSLSSAVPKIVADARSLRQIVLNLLSNAIKFNVSGGQVIVSTALEDSGEVMIRVRDTGIGIEDKDLASAMEPFRQLNTARRGGGTGLGLPLTKALVEANRASFTISSEAGRGTLAQIAFPTTRVLAD
ncbi:MAG: PAS domain-containing sensor histidine kinase [Hyphomicrobiales bacterium]|nr:MAG: PAS domain-containing sensor histidine kinase [Hyphomicrobiales bacterium]